MSLFTLFCLLKTTTIEGSKQTKDCEKNLGEEAERLERWNFNAPTSGPALTASWICSRYSQVPILGLACE